MILTKKQAEQIVRQGKNDKDKIVRILRSRDFTVFDSTGPGDRKSVALQVFNTDGTVTRIVSVGRCQLNVLVVKPTENQFCR